MKQFVIRRLAGLAGLALLLTVSPQTADAACGDPPGPGVDWSGCVKVALNYTGVDFSGANLQDLVITGSVLINARFQGANLQGTRFATSDLSGADFSGTRLDQVSFNSIRLAGANFQNAQLLQVNANDVNLTDANFLGAEIVDSATLMTSFCRTTLPDGTVEAEGCK